jgi:cyclase
MKFRVIPSILTNGNTVVKGTNFDNWRTVGNAQATAMLYASRNPDELMFLDVTATEQSRVIDPRLIQHFSNVLNVPFSVGGGIKSLKDVRICLRAGAERVVLGTRAITNSTLVTEIANEFGSQAVMVAIDILSKDYPKITSNSGKKMHEIDPVSFAKRMASFGAGELLIQTKSNDGMMGGLFTDIISTIVEEVDIPVILSSGAGCLNDFVNAYKLGVSGVAAGAFFQFTQFTPEEVRNFLEKNQVPVRRV